ncbi:MAG: ribosome maturation factor RimM [Alphaproteobacteria bacterium]|nr:ribosome maturation factor RimM [Alphaproteobacteria bacterium]
MQDVLEPADLPTDAVEVGRVLDAWGIKGWVKILPYSASPEALFSCRRWYLLASERGLPAFDGARIVRVAQAREHGDSVVAQFQDLADRNGAEALRGCRIFVPRSSFPTPQPDEYYWVDLMGLEVVNREGAALGQVHDLLSTGPQTVLVLQQTDGEQTLERMIPFVSAYVDQVDLPGKRIVVDWQAYY